VNSLRPKALPVDDQSLQADDIVGACPNVNGRAAKNTKNASFPRSIIDDAHRFRDGQPRGSLAPKSLGVSTRMSPLRATLSWARCKVAHGDVTEPQEELSGPLAQGYFALPTVFANVANDWRLAREEIFGPVLVSIRWTDESDAIRMANDSHYGLAAYIWTHDIGRALRTAHSIEAGWVQVNQGLGQTPGHSYGGIKQSGIGREFSLEGMLDSFTQKKNVTVNLNTPSH
jgi:hypothetical protein